MRRVPSTPPGPQKSSNQVGDTKVVVHPQQVVAWEVDNHERRKNGQTGDWEVFGRVVDSVWDPNPYF